MLAWWGDMYDEGVYANDGLLGNTHQSAASLLPPFASAPDNNKPTRTSLLVLQSA
jgi:hypothetical protein